MNSNSRYNYDDVTGAATSVRNLDVCYKYQGNLPKKETRKNTFVNYIDQSDSSVKTTVTTYCWNKTGATKKSVVQEDGSRSVSEEKINGLGMYSGSQGKLRTAEYEEGSGHVPGAFLLLICPSGVCAASCSAALFPDLPPRRHPVGHPNCPGAPL